MTAKEWFEALEDFFYDGHKEMGEEYSLKIGDEYFEYVVPEEDDWSKFYCRVFRDGDDAIMPVNQVFEIAFACGIEISVEILEYLEH